jgi:hypothetical protein
MKRILWFYDFMLVFLAACLFQDIYFGPVTMISFAWPVCFVYYYHRRNAVVKMLAGMPKDKKLE